MSANKMNTATDSRSQLKEGVELHIGAECGGVLPFLLLIDQRKVGKENAKSSRNAFV
jgi:hypothetical protein